MTLLAENDHLDKRKEIACSDRASGLGIGVRFVAPVGQERRYAYGRN
jgi:hypothetical protein